MRARKVTGRKFTAPVATGRTNPWASSMCCELRPVPAITALFGSRAVMTGRRSEFPMSSMSADFANQPPRQLAVDRRRARAFEFTVLATMKCLARRRFFRGKTFSDSRGAQPRLRPRPGGILQVRPRCLSANKLEVPGPAIRAKGNAGAHDIFLTPDVGVSSSAAERTGPTSGARFQRWSHCQRQRARTVGRLELAGRDAAQKTPSGSPYSCRSPTDSRRSCRRRT